MDILKYDNLLLYVDFVWFCCICDGIFGLVFVFVIGVLGGIYRNVNINK